MPHQALVRSLVIVNTVGPRSLIERNVVRPACARWGSRMERGVAILAWNSDRYFELLQSVAWAGGVFVPMNTRWSEAELVHGLNDCQARILCVGDEFIDTTAIRRDTAVDIIIYLGDGATPAGAIAFESLMDGFAPCQEAERCDDDLCGLFYTGGTTGHPKGVMLSHRNIIFGAMNWLACLHVSAETIYMHVAGFFHLGGAGPLFATTLAGGTNVILPKFAALPAMQAIQDHKVNYTLLIPVMVNTMLNEPAMSEYDLSSVRMCHYGGAPMPEAILRKVMMELPSWTFHQGYGLTETTAILTTLDWRQHAVDGPRARRLTSAGQLSPGWELKITDTEGRELPLGEVGEITVRGAGTMLGYWGKPEATQAVLRSGWLHTGDAAWMDDEGFVFIVDRFKDMIISGGENVYSTETENAIYKYPGVRECAVIGIPDEDWGERVHAVVVAKPGIDLTTEEIIAHCRTLIAGYKCPRSVDITTEPLPVSPTGKITKNLLREKYWAGRSRNVN